MTLPNEKRFPGRLHHRVPGWVGNDATFHIRIRSMGSVLTEPELARVLLDSVTFYHEARRWHATLCLLMPDHLHALLAFPPGTEMSKVVRAWKAYHTNHNGVCWQDGYFDHRIRSEEELESTWTYIRQNPVVKGLCVERGRWAWWWPGGD